MKRVFGSVVGAAMLLASGTAFAAEAEHPKQLHWPFDGMTGTVDRQAAQRGFQVYKEVCASCHSLHRVAYRQLADIGFSEEEIKAIAAEANVADGPNDAGEMFERPARPSDRFAAPFANQEAARASNNGAYPPDLDLIIKSRHDGANYVYSLLTGYGEAPHDVTLAEGMNYNPYFPGHQIAMPAPLTDDRVTYQDGTAATIDQMARDVVVFMQWAAEPEMEHRKAMGLKVLGFLLVMSVFLYIAKGIVWRDVK
ncbi:MAG: cytochrome c1 [Alphaproteobacteria bacterium]|nr:cytochrome c1 [Alphaproteobacteria bacterium]